MILGNGKMLPKMQTCQGNVYLPFKELNKVAVFNKLLNQV